MSTGKTASHLLVTLADAELIDHFIHEQSEAAFDVLTQRYGPMVMGICRRLLNDPQSAEDAFQATFLLLLQKCDRLKKPEQLGNWLYGVAYRIAARMRAQAARRRECKIQDDDSPVSDPTIDVAWREVRSVLDQEMYRLPERYRLPLVLCYLQGKTHIQAAEELGWPTGTMSGRLARAREVLRGRLTRRGVSLSASLFVFLLAEKAKCANLSPALLRATVRAVILTDSVLSQATTPALDSGQQSVAGLVPSGRFSSTGVGIFVLLLLIGVVVNVAFTSQSAGPRPKVDNQSQSKLANQQNQDICLATSPDPVETLAERQQ